MKERKSKVILRNIFVWLCVLFFVFPFYWLITTAFKNRVDAFAMPPKWMFTPVTDNFIKVFTTGEFMNSYYHSLIITFCATVVSILVGFPMAYALSNRFIIRNKQGILLWILSTKMAPPVMVAIPFYIIFRVLSLRDTYLGMVLIYMIFDLSFAVWMIRGFINGIPKELEEAARVDGATRLGSLFRVVLPLIRGGLAATAILCFITTWNEFLMALVLTGSKTKTAPITITSFISFEGIRWGEIAAAGVLVGLPVIIMGILVRNHLISGMTMGAIK
jgi:ABC-type glycerol-3-phosphate transport system permease component